MAMVGCAAAVLLTRGMRLWLGETRGSFYNVDNELKYLHHSFGGGDVGFKLWPSSGVLAVVLWCNIAF
jgi:hypothetical protein